MASRTGGRLYRLEGFKLQKVCDYLVSATRGKSGKLGKVVAEAVHFAVVNVTLYFVNSKE